ncbi:MAG: PrsW family intramembrane metalloprotease [Alphaproteobacteria bacterium]
MLMVMLQTGAALAPLALVLLYFSTHPVWRSIREAVWVAFGLGVVVAIPIAAAEYLVALPFQGLVSGPVFSAVKAFAIAAIPEETGKLLILVFLVMRHEDFSRPVQAIALATAVSLGFAAIENVLYVLDASDWAATALARSLTALPMHAATGLVMGHFACLTVSAKRHRYLYGILMLAVPVLLHTAYNFPVFMLAGLGAFSGAPIDPTTSPYYLLFALALATCIGAMVTVALRMHQAGQPHVVPALARRY